MVVYTPLLYSPPSMLVLICAYLMVAAALVPVHLYHS